jgi:hypothetical protein
LTLFPIAVLAHYIIEGPSVIWPTGSAEGEWLVTYLRASQFIAGLDPFVGLSMYVPGNETRPAHLLPLLRRVTWNRRTDLRDRLRDRGWPDLSIQFFRLENADFTQIDSRLRALDVALSNLGLPTKGFDIADLYREPEPSSVAPSIAENWIQRRLTRKIGGVELNLIFSNQEVPNVNEAFEVLWRGWEELCVESRIVENVNESYEIDLDIYADMVLRS